MRVRRLALAIARRYIGRTRKVKVTTVLETSATEAKVDR
jgi:hypothetical protein